MKKQVIHRRSVRLRNNAGLDFPLCSYLREGPLNLDHSTWSTSGELKDVTCKHCLRAMRGDGRFS